MTPRFFLRRWLRPGKWAFVALVALLASRPIQAETLTLAQCLREVAEHNPDVVQQRVAIEQAEASRLTLRSRSLPTLTFGGILGELNQSRSNDKGQLSTDDSFIVLGTGNLYQSIFDAAIPASYRRGTAEVIAAEQNFYAVASTQLHAARLLYYRALYQQQSGEVLRELDKSLEDAVKAQNQLVTAGLVGRSALLSAQVQRTNFAPGILDAGGSYRTNLASLLQLMGRELPYNKNGDDPLGRITLSGQLDVTARGFDAAEAARVALDRRPDLRALRALVRTAQEDANIARAGYYPVVRLYLAGEALPQSNVRNRPNAIRQSDQVQTTELRPGVSASWVVVDTGTVRGAVRAQEASRDVLGISLGRLESNLPAELAAVRARLMDAAARLDSLRGNEELGRSTLNILQGGVAQGINSQTELLFAQNDLLSTRSSELLARLELSLAHAEFDRLTGNYLRYVEENPVPTTTARRTSRK